MNRVEKHLHNHNLEFEQDSGKALAADFLLEEKEHPLTILAGELFHKTPEINLETIREDVRCFMDSLPMYNGGIAVLDKIDNYIKNLNRKLKGTKFVVERWNYLVVIENKGGAIFLVTNLQEVGMWVGRMEDGKLMDVNLK